MTLKSLSSQGMTGFFARLDFFMSTKYAFSRDKELQIAGLGKRKWIQKKGLGEKG